MLNENLIHKEMYVGEANKCLRKGERQFLNVIFKCISGTESYSIEKSDHFPKQKQSTDLVLAICCISQDALEPQMKTK